MSYPPIQGVIGVSSGVQKVVTANGTFILPDGITEVDLLEFNATDDRITVSMDFSNLIQKIKIRIYEKVDGITYRLAQSATFPNNFDGDQANVTLDGKGRDLKLTLQSLVAEGSVRNIPHARVEEVRII